MNLWIRVFMIGLMTLIRKKISPADTGITKFMVLPHDIDLNIHLNNGRFLTFMDLGRLDFIVRTGLARLFLKMKWNPVVASATVRYRKSIGLFKTFDLQTRIVGSDEKFVYIEQDFLIGQELYARGAVKICFLQKQKIVPLAKIKDSLSLSPDLTIPPWIEAWNDMDKSFLRNLPAKQKD